MRERRASIACATALVGLIVMSTGAFAIGTPKAIDPAGMQRLAADSGGSAKISLHRATGAARFVRLEAGSLRLPEAPSSSPVDLAGAFFAQYGGIFGVRNAAAELSPGELLVDHQGFSSVIYRQLHKGLPVLGGELRVHFDRDGNLIAANGSFAPDVTVGVAPTVKRRAARDQAVRTVVSQQTVRSTGEIQAAADRLLVLHPGLYRGVPSGTHLVYEVEVANPGRTILEFVYVDAHDGRVVDQITGIHDALDRKVSEGSLANVIWEDSEGDPDPIPAGWEGGTVNQVEAWQNEIDGARESYHLIRHITNDGFIGYDGADATMRTVNNDPSINCPNANWNGVSTNYCDGTASDDVVTHEWGHAYTDFTHNLIYAWQSGALNESISDIWGEVNDLVNGRGTDAPGGLRTDGACSDHGPGPGGDNSYRWLMGEDAWAFGGAIRDMWTPTCAAATPGKVSDPTYWCSTGDGGGVHFNSGIPNHAFALLVDGGSYNGQTINGIGLDRASAIYWRVQAVYQSPATDFAEHADALEAACSDLIGVDIYEVSTTDGPPVVSGDVIAAADCAEVAKAIEAVEFRLDPVQCGFEDMLDPNAPPLCDGLGTKSTIFFEDWEGGLGAWIADTREVANPSTFDTPDWAVVSDLPDGEAGQGAYVLNSPDLGDCLADDESGILYLESPTIALPGSAVVPRIAFDHWHASEAGWDGGNVKVSVNGGPFTLVPGSAFNFNDYNGVLNSAPAGNTNPMESEEAFTGANEGSNSGGWGQSQISLLGIATAGDDVKLRFEMGQDGCNGAIGWYVDEVEAFSCSDEGPGGLCGNGQLDLDEECDDGNTDNGDGCSDACLVEEGWECTDPIPPTDPQNVVADFSFEAGTPNPFWD
jgi:cysteine-rich repeat protein